MFHNDSYEHCNLKEVLKLKIIIRFIRCIINNQSCIIDVLTMKHYHPHIREEMGKLQRQLKVI